MRNIADQFPVLLFIADAFLHRLLQAQSHILVVAVQITNLTFCIRLQRVVVVTFLDLFHSHIQLINGAKYAFSNPLGQHETGEKQNQRNRYEHIYQQFSGNQ